MHPSGVDHLALRGVPQRIVSLSAFQLGLTIEVLPFVRAMLVQGATRPRLTPVEAVIARVEADKVDGELSPHDELLEKRISVGLGRLRLPHGQCHRTGTDVTEVQVG